MELTIEQYEAYSPLSAHIGSKPKAQRDAIIDKLSLLDEDQQEVLTSTETAEALMGLVQKGTIPQKYARAVVILVALVGLGEAKAEQMPQLLEKIGLDAAAAAAIVAALRPTIAPLLLGPEIAQAEPITPTELPRIAPLTTTDALAHGASSPHNVVDLRQPDRQAGKQPPSA